MAQLIKNAPATWETWVQFLSWEDPLEKGKATHSSILTGRIPWIVESMGLQRIGHDTHLPIGCAHLRVFHTLELPRFSNAMQLLTEMVGRVFLLIGRDTVVFKKSAN